jgi:hypothetical protein
MPLCQDFKGLNSIFVLFFLFTFNIQHLSIQFIQFSKITFHRDVSLPLYPHMTSKRWNSTFTRRRQTTMWERLREKKRDEISRQVEVASFGVLPCNNGDCRGEASTWNPDTCMNLCNSDLHIFLVGEDNWNPTKFDPHQTLKCNDIAQATIFQRV